MYIKANGTNFGFGNNNGFGSSKAAYSPPPAPPEPESTTIEEPSLTVDDDDEPKVETEDPKEALVEEIKKTEKGSPARRALLARLAATRKRIAKKQADKLAEIHGVRQKHVKQAAYGKGVGHRPKGSGYLTESETIMGGGSGYYAIPKPKPADPALDGYSALGQTEETSLDKASRDVEQAAALVKQLTKDVKSGVIPRSELAQAIEDLSEKVDKAEILSDKAKGLSGYGEGFSTSKLLYAAIGAAVAYYILIGRT